MGNFIFGFNFVDFTAAASTEVAPYVDTNLRLNQHPKRRWQTSDLTDSNMKLDFGSAAALAAVVLVDVNFTQCYFRGNTSDAWGSPPFRYPAAGNLTIAKDARTQRYNVYIPVSGFNYRYGRLDIPAQAVTDGEDGYRIGSIVCLSSAAADRRELTDNPAAYDCSADEAMTSSTLPSGRDEDVNQGDHIWTGTLGFDKWEATQEADGLWLNSIQKHLPLVFYENLGDTSAVYVCKRRTPVRIEWNGDDADLKSIDRITYKEIR